MDFFFVEFKFENETEIEKILISPLLIAYPIGHSEVFHLSSLSFLRGASYYSDTR